MYRLRTDFVTRPPRISAAERDRMWRDADATASDVVALEPLARMKMTMREKDYAVIGELARRMDDPRTQLLYSRSSRDLIRLTGDYPEVHAAAMTERPLLAQVAAGREALDEALDRERRALMRADEARLERYRDAASAWAAAWPVVARQVEGLPLDEAHRIVSARAEHVLPWRPLNETTMSEPRDQFLSEEDRDLRNLSDDELIAYWNLWLAQAQITNDLDRALYSHGVFERDPAEDRSAPER